MFKNREKLQNYLDIHFSRPSFPTMTRVQTPFQDQKGDHAKNSSKQKQIKTIENQKNAQQTQTVKYESLKRLLVTKKDLSLIVKENTWLNDKHIDFYITWLQEEQKDNRFFFFLSDFWVSLKNDVERHAIRGHKEVQLLQKQFLLIPINAGAHWLLCIVCYPGQLNMKYIVMDSLQTGKVPKKHLTQFLTIRSELERKGDRIYIENAPWVFPKVPLQENGHDCGLYMLHYAELFYKQVPDENCLEKWFPKHDIQKKRQFIFSIMKPYVVDCSLIE